MLTGHLRSSSSCQIPWHYRTARCRQEPSALRRPVNPAAYRLAQNEVHTPIHHQLVRTDVAGRPANEARVHHVGCLACTVRCKQLLDAFVVILDAFAVIPRIVCALPWPAFKPSSMPTKTCQARTIPKPDDKHLPLKPPTKPAATRALPKPGPFQTRPLPKPNPFQSPVEIRLGPPNPPTKPVSCLRTKDPLPWSFFAIKTLLRGLEACSIKQYKGNNPIMPVQSRAYCSYSKQACTS